MHVCNGAGGCLPQTKECASGYCFDGVCCDSACGGTCEACAEPGSIGTCLAVKGAPRTGRAPCVGAGTACGGQCDGTAPFSCAFPSADVTCGAGCAGASVQRCDGAGSSACVAPAPAGTSHSGGCARGAPGGADAKDCAATLALAAARLHRRRRNA